MVHYTKIYFTWHNDTSLYTREDKCFYLFSFYLFNVTYTLVMNIFNFFNELSHTLAFYHTSSNF